MIWNLRQFYINKYLIKYSFFLNFNKETGFFCIKKSISMQILEGKKLRYRFTHRKKVYKSVTEVLNCHIRWTLISLTSVVVASKVLYLWITIVCYWQFPDFLGKSRLHFGLRPRYNYFVFFLDSEQYYFMCINENLCFCLCFSYKLRYHGFHCSFHGTIVDCNN